MNHVELKIFGSPEWAPRYRAEDGYSAAELQTVCIVRRGTKEGRATVDLVFHSGGQKYVAMITGRTLKMIAGVIQED